MYFRKYVEFDQFDLNMKLYMIFFTIQKKANLANFHLNFLFPEKGPPSVRASWRGVDEDRPLSQPPRPPQYLRTQAGGGQ